MRERLKSVLLFYLVVNSIVLTGLLLFGQPALETAAPSYYEPVVFGELRPVREQLLPQLRLQEQGRWKVLQPWDYAHLPAWEEVQRLWHILDTPELRERPEISGGPSLQVIFPSAVPPEIFFPASKAAGLAVKEISWQEDQPEDIWFLAAGGQWYYARGVGFDDGWGELLTALFDSGPEYFAASAEDWPAFRLGERPVLLPVELPALAPFSVKPEILDSDRLLRNLFLNTALVRLIEESDGALIYTDGQSGLRLFESGHLEYSSPKNEPGQEPMEMTQILRRTAEYLHMMGGWPDHMYLDEISSVDRRVWNWRQRDTYTAVFISVQYGIRVLAQEAALQIRFSNQGVVQYERQIFLLDLPTAGPALLIDPRAAAAALSESIAGDGQEIFLLDIQPAYFLDVAQKRQKTAQPVWVFYFDNGRTAVVNGHTGHLITWL